MVKSIIKIIIILLICILFVKTGFTQVKNGQLHINTKADMYSLNGTWKFSYGDNPEWRKPDFDDSTWIYIKFPGSIATPKGKNKPGIFWYRMDFYIQNKDFYDKTFYLSLTRISHVYELYINGIKISKRGIFPENNKKWQQGIGGYHGILDSKKLFYDKKNVIAIKVYGGYKYLSGALLDYSYIGLYDFKSNIYVLFLFLNNAISIIMIVFGLFILFSYVHKRDFYPKIWLAFTTLFFGLMNIFKWLPDKNSAVDTQIYYYNMLVFGIISEISFIIFIYSFLDNGYKKLKRSLIILIFIYVIFTLFGQSGFLVSPFHFTYFFTIFITNILIAVLLYIAIKDFAIKKKSSFYVIIGVIVVVSISITNAILQYLQISIPPSSVLYNPFASFIFLFCIFLSIERGIAYGEFKVSKRFASKWKKEKFLKNVQSDELKEKLETLLKVDKIYRDESITLVKLAETVSINHQTLSAYLNDTFSMNFNSFINSYRVEEAKELLIQENNKTITEIAFEVGFNSMSRFYEAFRKITNVTPKEFRKKK